MAQRLDSFGFQRSYDLQAAATRLDGSFLTHRDDFMSTIGHYIRNSQDVRLWKMIRKELAEADLNREAIEGQDPESGFMSKNNMNPPVNDVANPASHDLSDPGQLNKAIGGIIQTGHYTESMWRQQGKPYGNQLSDRTMKLISSMVKNVERALFRGNATTNPLEFNGLEQQMDPTHLFEADITAGDSVVKKLRGIVRLSISDETILRSVTHIFTTALGVQLLEDETDMKLEYHNLDRVSPGLSVPSIVTHRGLMPIVDSPFLRDEKGATDADPDYIDYWLLDINSLCWKGVIPKGANVSNPNSPSPSDFDPQIFDITRYTGMGDLMVETRIGLMYGTLYAKNRGQGIWKLRVKVPPLTVASI